MPTASSSAPESSRSGSSSSGSQSPDTSSIPPSPSSSASPRPSSSTESRQPPQQPAPTPASDQAESTPRGSGSFPNLPSSLIGPASIPFLPPIGQGKYVASEMDLPPDHPMAASPTETLQQHQQQQQQQQPAIPEKCLTFCSQKADAPTFCRMFCLRKLPPLPTQSESLARLRSAHKRLDPIAAANTESNRGIEERQSSLEPLLDSPPRSYIQSAVSPLAMFRSVIPSWDGKFSWNPIESLRNAVLPYSIIYVRGTADGVVGRYMEELEANDGTNDFGSLSRGVDERTRRKREASGTGWEYLDWGADGRLLYLPLTSVFYPILSLPNTLSKIFTPAQKFWSMYTDSFTSGAQRRGLANLRKEVEEGGALRAIDKMSAWHVKRVEKIMAERKAAMETENAAREKLEVERKIKRAQFEEGVTRMAGKKDVDGKRE